MRKTRTQQKTKWAKPKRKRVPGALMIQPIGIFATPKDVQALTAYVNSFNGSESVVAHTIMGMTWNFLASQVNP